MTTEQFDPGVTQDAIDEAYQEVIDETNAAQATEAAQPVDAPAEDPFAEAARKLTEPKQPEPEYVDRQTLEQSLGAFAKSIREDVSEAIKSGLDVGRDREIEITPDVEAFTEIITENVENPDPEEVAAAQRRYVAARNARASQPQSETDGEVLRQIRARLDELSRPTAPVQSQWSKEEERHIINAINYASAGAGLNIDFRDTAQLNAVMHGVQQGEGVDSVMRKVYDNINNIRDRTRQTISNPAPSSAATIPSLDSAPTRQTELVIETREDFLEAVADGRVSIGEYPRYAALFS